MAQLVLTAVGTAVGGPLGGAIGGVLGGLADRALVSALTPARTVGGRLSGLELHSTSVGAPMPCTWGRARVAAQTIWAARFREKKVEQRTGGGKGGASATTVRYAYSLSFAVALGEGPIDGVGRIWADGAVMDMTDVTWRLHTGEPDQLPDALIEAVEGEAPAYRNTAYLVFEDLPLETWGNRPPQLNVEVYRRPPQDIGLEQRLTSVNLIPGAGEFVLAPTPQLRITGEATYASENVHNAQGRPDLLVALDQLQAQLPMVDHVNLVVAWFGDDLRCGFCEIRPGVESLGKATRPDSWRVEVERADAHPISFHAGGPAYGGTPSDTAVLACIAELRARGLAVTLYPFLMMDIPPGAGRVDPYGAVEQAPYPWRGRITGEFAPGRPHTTDGTAAAAEQVQAFFGAAPALAFDIDAQGVVYAGPEEWSYRRLVLHYARLAQASGGVEGFLIGSELVGLTTLRAGPGDYPAVAHLRQLAGDVKAMLGPAVKVGYAGDWTEYFGHQPPDGSGEVRFHLDPLWADPAIDFVGVDFYQPLADWRGGTGGLDAAAGARGPHDIDYLRANVLGGENADWFYASLADRLAQTRTPITDGAYDEPWVYRSKDLHAWWSNAHHDRPGGVRSASPTAWAPGMKPLRIVEFGCPAVDRGSNSPNLFIDPKSSESGLPISSTGRRDDLAQRRAVEAVLLTYGDPSAAPLSPVYGLPMIERLSAWCWDTRPYPDFPVRTAVWRDAPNWTLGHWLTGRVGMGDGGDMVRALLLRAGLTEDDFTIEGVTAIAAGYVVPGPMSTADALQPLALALAVDLTEQDGRVAVIGRDAPARLALGADDLHLPDDAPDPARAARTLAPTPDLVRVRFLDEADAYQAGSVVRRAPTPGGGGPESLDVPVVLDAGTAAGVADRRLGRALSERDALDVTLAPGAALTLEPGDIVSVEGHPGAWRTARVDLDETPRARFVRVEGPAGGEGEPASDPRADPVPEPLGPPAFQVLDLPPLDGVEGEAGPLVAVATHPWRPFDVSAGPSAAALTLRATTPDPAVMGVTLSTLPVGPLWRWDRATRLQVRCAGAGVLASATREAVLAGANALAVLNVAGVWEVLQFSDAELVADGVYVLSGLLRGQLGTEEAMIGVAPGAPCVRLGPELVRARTALSERSQQLLWRAAPSGGPPGGHASSDGLFAWRGRAWRPFAPVHLRAERTPTGARMSWIRRARLGGDGWDGEVPQEEPVERYAVSVSGATLHESFEVGTPELTLDLPALTSAPTALVVSVQQWGAAWNGYGGACTRTLWL